MPSLNFLHRCIEANRNQIKTLRKSNPAEAIKISFLEQDTQYLLQEIASKILNQQRKQ